MKYFQRSDEEASIQLTLDEVYGEGAYTVYTSIDGAGYEVHNSIGDCLGTFETAIEVEYSYLN